MFFFPFLLENSIIEVVLHISTSINNIITEIYINLFIYGSHQGAFLQEGSYSHEINLF